MKTIHKPTQQSKSNNLKVRSELDVNTLKIVRELTLICDFLLWCCTPKNKKGNKLFQCQYI